MRNLVSTLLGAFEELHNRIRKNLKNQKLKSEKYQLLLLAKKGIKN
jgi:hypothetical protein